jgi:hypothetical protein
MGWAAHLAEWLSVWICVRSVPELSATIGYQRSHSLSRRFQKPLNSFQWCPILLDSDAIFVNLKFTGPRGPWGFESLALRQLYLPDAHAPV